MLCMFKLFTHVENINSNCLPVILLPVRRIKEQLVHFPETKLLVGIFFEREVAE